MVTGVRTAFNSTGARLFLWKKAEKIVKFLWRKVFHDYHFFSEIFSGKKNRLIREAGKLKKSTEGF